MAVILKLGKKYQITYEVVTPTKEIKSIKEIFDNYEDAAKRKELLDGEVCMFSPESLFVDVMEDWLADPYFRDHLKKYHEAQKNYDAYLRNMIQTKKVKEVDSNLANSIINQLCATKSIGRNSALSVKTIRACKLLLISTCDHAIKMGIMDENPFNEIHISDPHDFKKRPKKYADWTYETMIQIFDACKEEKLYVIMQIVFATGMNVTDFLGSLAVESIVGNSDFILMLNQHSGDQKILAEKLNISKHQISFVNNSNAGEGLSLIHI